MAEQFFLKRINQNKPLVLLPSLPVLFFFIHNINQYGDLILSWDVLVLSVAYLTFAYIILFGFHILLKKNPGSFSLTAVTLTAFLYYGVFQDTLLKSAIVPIIGNSLVLFLLIIFLLIVLVILFRKKNNIVTLFNNYLSWLFSFIIFYELILLIGFKTPGKDLKEISKNLTTSILEPVNDGLNERPDIYHIIFDGYTNKNALSEYWGYENSIYKFLDSCNFYTVDSAMSNYNFTPLSIASVFNLQYLNNGDKLAERNASNFFAALPAYENNQLFSVLKKKGYHLSIFSFLSNQKDLTAFGSFAPEKPQLWLRKQTFERTYLNPWIKNKLKKIIGKEEAIPTAVKKNLEHYKSYNERALKHIYSSGGDKKNNTPIFSFTHFLLPHGPYIFDETGKSQITLNSPNDEMKNYLEQIKYANLLIRQITEYLLKNSPGNKIIIFQGDHGYRKYENVPVNRECDALCAFYFSSKNYSGLTKKLSHVNTYRLVLNNCFDYHLPLLKDSIVNNQARK